MWRLWKQKTHSAPMWKKKSHTLDLDFPPWNYLFRAIKYGEKNLEMNTIVFTCSPGVSSTAEIRGGWSLEKTKCKTMPLSKSIKKYIIFIYICMYTNTPYMLYMLLYMHIYVSIHIYTNILYIYIFLLFWCFVHGNLLHEIYIPDSWILFCQILPTLIIDVT